MDGILRELAAKQAITELIYTYCRAVDRRDVSLGHSIWHDDGQADYGEFYRGSGKGVIDAVCQSHPYLVHPLHQVGNILIELDDDKAASEAGVIVIMQGAFDGTVKQLTTGARYLDKWECRDGRWGLVYRLAVTDFYTLQDVRHHGAYAGCTIAPADDPSYRFLTAPK